MTDAAADLLPGFEPCPVTLADGSRIHAVAAGQGPTILLLHGWPQTHLAWHKVAPVLARDHRVVVADLPGYGDSRIAPGGRSATAPSRRSFAADLLEAMALLGHDRFAAVGHDRGARAGYRMALDAPERITAFASLTVEPTLEVWERIDGTFALRAPHWFLFGMDPVVLESLFAPDPLTYLDRQLTAMAAGGTYHPLALAGYRAAFARAEVRAAIYADYRAALTTDLDEERADRTAGRRIRCPVLYLWSGTGRADPFAIWRQWADRVEGRGLPGGHMQPEMAAGEVVAALMPFLRAAIAAP